MSVLYPIYALVLLHFIILIYLFKTRVAEMTKNKIHPQKVATRSMAQSIYIHSSPADNYQNLFEMPVVFYVLGLLAIILKIDSQAVVVLAWLYVILRYIHSFIHCTYNKVMHRFYAFASSNFVLILYFGFIVKNT